jgi:anti-sigma B factor antagonist
VHEGGGVHRIEEVQVETPTPTTPGIDSVPGFTLRTAMPAPGHAEARLIGDLDLANAPLVRDELVRMLEEGLTRLSIDLSDLTFLDSTGIAALVVVRKHAHELGVELDVHSPRVAISHVLEACGVDELFGLGHPDPAC